MLRFKRECSEIVAQFCVPNSVLLVTICVVQFCLPNSVLLFSVYIETAHRVSRSIYCTSKLIMEIVSQEMAAGYAAHTGIPKKKGKKKKKKKSED